LTREAFEHAVRAAAAVLDAREVLVIGSQALHASVEGKLPPEALRSVEVDVAAVNGDPDGRKADLIDGSIGEASMFHETFGYYAQGVGETTAKLPHGWEERTIRVQNENTRGAAGLCLEVHDLAISKLIPWREKDQRFVRALVTHAMVEEKTLRERLAKTELVDALRTASEARLDRLFGLPSGMSA
jgi:hypothetical protein